MCSGVLTEECSSLEEGTISIFYFEIYLHKKHTGKVWVSELSNTPVTKRTNSILPHRIWQQMNLLTNVIDATNLIHSPGGVSRTTQNNGLKLAAPEKRFYNLEHIFLLTLCFSDT